MRLTTKTRCCYLYRVLFNGVELKDVVMADEESGVVERLKIKAPATGSATFAVYEVDRVNGGAVTYFETGKVEIIRPPVVKCLPRIAAVTVDRLAFKRECFLFGIDVKLLKLNNRLRGL